MKITEKKLRYTIRSILKELRATTSLGGSSIARTAPNADDRRFAPAVPIKSSIEGGDISKSDATKLMSMSVGFFDVLINSIRFGFLTREEVNRICDNLESGCEDNFRNIVISHPCLKWWKNDVSKIAEKIADNSQFKKDFCESIKSNCEMVRSNYNRAQGNIKQIMMR